MSILSEYLTEPELLEELAKRGIKRSKRWAQEQRKRRRGPPWALIGNVVVYHGPGFNDWLKAGIQYPVRSRRRLAAESKTA
jgi:hypothetical protein